MIDIGSWIGPTALLACWFGASRVRLVEANPVTVDLLEQSRRFDKRLAALWDVVPVCVAPEAGEVTFGTASGALTASSATSDRGSGAVVKAQTYFEVIQGINDPAIIKIDIEGSEIKILKNILECSALGAAIWLSWHPPFWQEPDDLESLLRRLYEHHWVLDSDFKPLSFDSLFARVNAKDPKPSWGTQHGNFFETAVLSKQRFDADGARRLS